MDKRLIEAVELFEEVMLHGTERVLKAVDAPVWQEFSREQIQVLKMISKNGSLPAGKIASLQGVHKSAISSRLKKLQEKKLVRIVRSSEDQRTKEVELTDAGEEVVRQSDSAVYEYVEKLFSDQVNDEELDQFVSMFKKIREILKLDGV